MKTQFSFCQPKKLLTILLASFMFLACSPEKVEDDPGSGTANAPADMISSTVTIGSAGGEIAISSPNGSVRLTVPNGALSTPTEITVYTRKENDLDDLRIGFEPDGLIFQKPARLHISLSQDIATTYALSSMWHISDLNDLINMGSEEHKWERMKNIEIGSNGQSMSGEMRHFSTAFVLLAIQREAYLVVDLPGKYLRPGDALFVMSADLSYEYGWFPGHVGLVNSLNPNSGTSDGNLMVIESTLGGGAAGNVDGVQTNPFLRFKRTSQHLYMGARRPTGPNVPFTDGERQGTLAKANAQLGLGYDYLGGAAANKWSCSELVEAAWDNVFRGVFKAGSEFFPSPVEMYEKTTRVSDITVKVGEQIKIPVYPVVVDKSSNIKLGTGFYNAGNPSANSTMTMAGSTPSGSTFSVDNTHIYKASTFNWTPKPSDAGSTVRITFNMVGSVTLNSGQTIPYNIYEHLDITVNGAYTTLNITPVQMGSSGLFYDYYFPIPVGAIIGPNSTTHLVDVATGAYPVNPVFPNQILDSFVEGWIDPVQKTHYGMTLHISRQDNPFDPAPPGQHTWGYYLEYDVPKYNGF